MSQSEHRGSRIGQAALRELRALVAHRQVKLRALSAATGIPRSSLHHKLSGRSALTVADLVVLSIALDVPAADLLARATAASDADDTADPQEIDNDKENR